MTEEYFTLSDFKSLIIGMIGSLLILAMNRIWLNFTAKGTLRRLKQNEAYRNKIDTLAKSDRALIIYGFQGLFAIIAFGFLVLVFQEVLFVTVDPRLITIKQIGRFLLWLSPALVCMGFVWALQNVSDYPKSTEKLDERIAKLKDKLSAK